MTDFRFSLDEREAALFRQGEEIAAAFPRPSGRPFTRDELLAIYARLAPTGYLGSVLPEAAGGAELGALGFAALLEGLSPGLALIGNHSVQRYLHAFGSPGQKERYLSDLLAGRSIAAIAITEPGVGGDLSRIGTTATACDGGYILDGQKTWVTHGPVADLVVVLAMTTVGPTRFLVRGDAPGLTCRRMEPMGLSHMSFGELTLSGVAVAAEDRFGPEGEGHAGAKSAFPIARVLAALQAIRIGEAALETARGYARSRTLFGQSLADSAEVQARFAALSGELAGGRLLSYAAATRLGSSDAIARSAVAKSSACAAAVAACRWAGELLGSTGLLDRDLARHLADANMMAVVDGTVALNRFVAARRALSPGR